MLMDKLKALVCEHHGQMFDFDSDGMLVTGSISKQIKFLSPFDDDTNESDILHEVLQFFIDINAGHVDAQTDTKFYSVVDLDFEDAVGSLATDSSFLQHVLNLLENGTMNLRLHFLSLPADWKKHLEFFLAPLNEVRNLQRLAVEMIGPFPILNSVEKDFLYTQRLFTYYRVDSDCLDNVRKESVEDMAKYGLRVPFVFHVSKNNIRKLSETLEKTMEINYCSGFLFPLESERFFLTSKEDPPRAEYLKFLAEIYESCPYFDDVLYPYTQAFYELYESDSPLRRLRWTGEAFYEFQEQDNVIVIRNLLKQAFLWQRWKLEQRLQEPFPKNDCADGKGQEDDE